MSLLMMLSRICALQSGSEKWYNLSALFHVFCLLLYRNASIRWEKHHFPACCNCTFSGQWPFPFFPFSFLHFVKLSPRWRLFVALVRSFQSPWANPIAQQQESRSLSLNANAVIPFVPCWIALVSPSPSSSISGPQSDLGLSCRHKKTKPRFLSCSILPFSYEPTYLSPVMKQLRGSTSSYQTDRWV